MTTSKEFRILSTVKLLLDAELVAESTRKQQGWQTEVREARKYIDEILKQVRLNRKMENEQLAELAAKLTGKIQITASDVTAFGIKSNEFTILPDLLDGRSKERILSDLQAMGIRNELELLLRAVGMEASGIRYISKNGKEKHVTRGPKTVWGRSSQAVLEKI